MSSLNVKHTLSPIALAISLSITTSYVQAAEIVNVDTEVKKVEETEKKIKSIESIVVVGQTTNSVILPEELEKYQANDLADVFRLVPSVTVGGSIGIAQKVYIRGMEDTLFNVTVDGAPQTGTLFHHIGRVSIEPELLQEVDVQAGAGEATSGSGAIGGALRFKTKNVDDLLTAGDRFGGTLQAGYFTNAGYKTSGTFYGALTDDWGLLGSYTYIDRDDMVDGDGNDLYGTAAKQSLGFFKLNGNLTDNQSITLSYEDRNENGDFSQRPNWPALEADTLFPLEAERQTIIFNHHYAGGDLVQLETTLYQTKSSVEQDVFTRWGRYGGDMKTIGFDIRNSTIIDNHGLTYGIEYRQDEVTAQSLEIDADPAISEKGTVGGIYFQDHWQLSADLLLSFGLRYDQYDLKQVTFGLETDSDGFSPNVGLTYDINNNWQLNVGYAQAMRGKEVGDSFTIESGDGAIDPNLKPEEVENTEVALTYHNEKWHLVATIYQSDVDNVVFDQIGQGVYFENIGTLATKGFELKAGYSFENLTVLANYTNNTSELNGDTVEGYEHNGLANERGDTFGFNLNYTLSDNIELGWNYTYVAELNDIEVLQRAVDIGWIDQTYTIDKPSYQLNDIYVQWQPLNSDTLTLNLTVQNAFNEQYRDHSSVGDYGDIPGWEGIAGLYEAGRDIRIGASYKF
ncbi:TonB-dependent receptor [Colwellia echini]|uniref:TonB-dependent receptor n=1 Tax=Colwellia echini TaxID=1982103 RepID=A0ABY3MW17_9GAMM|nr:TonB-dependent receptor [Colwellia echini]TYK65395.1 TonB-dependent receptor [Colwellia echini]